MRITFVLPVFDLSGGVRVVAQYADRLRRRGHEVMVVGCPPAPLPLRARVRGWVRARGSAPRPRPGASHLDGLDVPRKVLERRRPVRASDVPDADVVIATWWETAEWVAELPREKGAGVHFVQNDEAHPAWLAPAQRARAAAAQKLPLAKITISRSLDALLRGSYGVRHVDVVPNAVELELFRAPPRGRQRRPTVGLLYSDNPLKGVDVTLRALERMRRELPELQVLAFGTQPVQPALPLPPGASFEQRPSQERIRSIYASCDVWLCGSRCEGYHLPPLEAMACRTPVVSTRVGGPDDFVVDGGNGYVVDVGDDAALAERTLRILRTGDDDWRSLSDAAHRTAHAWTYDDATRAFERALERIVARRHARAAQVAV
jgi:glycosyltransferase involved in cell wall biosynthesis